MLIANAANASVSTLTAKKVHIKLRVDYNEMCCATPEYRKYSNKYTIISNQ